MQFLPPPSSKPKSSTPPAPPKASQSAPPPPTAQQKAALYFNQALQATRQGKLPQAEKLYRQMLELDPKAGVGWINLAMVLGRQRRFDDAIATAQKAIRLMPKEAGFVAQLASLEWGANRLDEAISTAKSALALAPKNTDALRTLAGAYLAQRRFVEAIPPLKSLAALQPKDPTFLGTLATAQVDAKQPGDALATLRILTQRFPKEENAFLMRADLAGRLAAEKKDTKLFTESRDAYQRAFTLNPKNLRAGFNVAIAAEQVGDASGALKQLELLRERFPEAALVRHSLALAYLGDIRRTPQDRVTLGLKEAEAAVGREPKNAEYVATLGFMLLSQGSSKEYGQRAARVFEGALKLDHKNERAKRGLTEALIVQNAWTEVIPRFQELLKATPNDDVLRRKLAIALQSAGRRGEAATELRTIAQNNPKDTKTLKELALLLESDSKLDEATKALEEALTRDITDTDTHLRLGGILTRQAQYEKAQGHFEAVLTKQPTSSEAYAGLVTLFETQKKSPEALATRERWIKADPKNNTARYELAMLYAEQGRDGEAQALIRSLTLRQGDPNRNLYRQALAEFYRRKGRFGDETKEIQSLLSEEPNNEGLKVRLAEALGRAGKPDEAETTYKALIAKSPENNLKYRLALIELHERIGKTEQAIQETEDLVSLRTSSNEARALLIRLRTNQKRPEAAAQFFEKVALSEVTNPNPYLVSALEELYRSQGTPEKFIEFTKKCVTTYPKSAAAWKRRAGTLENAKQPEEALGCWQKATELDTTDAEAPYQVGRLLEAQSKKPEAIVAYQLSLKRQRTEEALAALKRLGAK
jgi:superkiller protein 3